MEKSAWRTVEVLGKRRLLRVIFRFVSVGGCSWWWWMAIAYAMRGPYGGRVAWSLSRGA